MREGRLRDVGMQKLNDVSNYDGICIHINDQESAVVFKAGPALNPPQ